MSRLCHTCWTSHEGICPKLINPTAPATPGQRDELLKVRWGAREITLRSTDGAATFLGATGVDGLILTVRRNHEGKFIARLEDRAMNNAWASPTPKHEPKIAVAALHREVKRLARAAAIRGAA